MTAPALPAGAPWWEYLLGLTLVGLVTFGVAWLQNRPVRRVVRQVATDAAVTRTHAENSHADADYPNMRDELTAARLAAEAGARDSAAALDVARQALGAVGSVRRELEQQRGSIEGVRGELEGVRGDVRRTQAAADKAADAAGRVAQDLTSHLADADH